MNEKITIADIAQKVNVSPSTVSRIINQKGKYTEETIEKVQEAIQELGYSPNIAAKTLRTRKSNLVGIMISDITNDFFNSLADNLVRELIACDFSPVVCITYNDEKNEARYSRMLASLNASGIVYILKGTPVNPACAGIPSVFIGSAMEMTDTSMNIQFDIVGGAKKATEELISAGCRRILYLSSSRKRNSHVGRYLGFQQALWENGIELDERLTATTSKERGRRVSDVIDAVLENQVCFDGVFANTVTAAIEAVSYLKSKGFRIPEDIKVMSFENGRSAELYNPSISAIEMDPISTSHSAAAYLHAVVEDKQAGSQIMRVPATIYRRDSTDTSGKIK